MRQDRMTRVFPARIAAIAAAPVLLAGCISLGPDVPDSLLTLTPTTDASAEMVTSGTASTAIAIQEPTAPQRLNVTRVPVQIDDTNVAYLEGATWVERPARLFRNLLAETIRARSGRLVIGEENYALTPENQLRGALREFGYDARSSSVVVRYDAIRDVNGEAMQTRRFESVVSGVPAEAGPVGAALNRAANDVAQQVADWVG